MSALTSSWLFALIVEKIRPNHFWINREIGMKPVKPRYWFILLILGFVLVTLPACSDKNSMVLDKSFTLEGFGTLQYPKSWSLIQNPPHTVLVTC